MYRVPRSSELSLESLAGLSEADEDRLLEDLSEDESIGVLAALLGEDEETLGSLGRRKRKRKLKGFFKKLKKKLKIPKKLKAKLKKVGKFLKKKAGVLITVAASAIKKIYPMAGPLVDKVAGLLKKGLSKGGAIKKLKTGAAALIGKAEDNQAALARIATKVQKSVVDAKLAGKPVPKKIVITAEAIEKEARGEKVRAVSTKPKAVGGPGEMALKTHAEILPGGVG